MKSWTFIDREGWAKGPWQSEPEDKVVWKDDTTGLDCMMHRNRLGAWCGYVGVKSSHKFYEVDYSEVFDEIDVHGGLTFSSECSGMRADGSGICHPADEGDHVWWFGFDCSHYCDANPKDYLRDKGLSFTPEGTYRSKDYVMEEVRKLAKQLL